MASKTSQAFSPDQMRELSGAIKAFVGVTQNSLDAIGSTFKKLKGDEIIGESTQKAPIVEAILETEQVYSGLIEKMGRMSLQVDSVCEKLGIGVNTNIRTSDEAVAAINAQAKKISEATGANA